MDVRVADLICHVIQKLQRIRTTSQGTHVVLLCMASSTLERNRSFFHDLAYLQKPQDPLCNAMCLTEKRLRGKRLWFFPDRVSPAIETSDSYDSLSFWYGRFQQIDGIKNGMSMQVDWSVIDL